ncbi:transporter [Actinomadura rubrobrunea]|uniref:Transporter n=1 Tax=Actinomadura rubrobrunea TaxID=115335 RepID=A0A9W6UYH1_9ACTN|nr:SLC13 family permease [Actinomadura rubrobrunea]GLW65705.1 transporter [Actinomadura rubrobrunea]
MPNRTTGAAGVVPAGAGPSRRIALAAAAAALGAAALFGPGPGLSGEGRITLAVFAVATLLWMFGRIDDVLVAVAAALVLAVARVLDPGVFLGGLAGPTTLLLVCAFVIAGGVARTGLATRAAAHLAARARGVRGLVHLTTAALVAAVFAIPATSGRAALALPVFVALARTLGDRRRMVLALALLFPTVILLSAVASLIGAGAHLITAEILADTTGERIGFLRWLVLGTPLALVSSHLAAELILVLTTTRDDRRRPVRVRAADVGEAAGVRVTGRLTGPQARSAGLLAAVVALWCTEPLHGVPPAAVAVIGAIVTVLPGAGTIGVKAALSAVPWRLMVFLAATTAMGVAVTTSGAARWLGGAVFGAVTGPDRPPAWLFLAVVVAVSTAAHLVLQSRSARSSVLVPLVIAASSGAGVAPAAAAFASTAAAGFCQTLPSSAKPVALFHTVDGAPTYTTRDLMRTAAVLGPVTAALVLAFALWVWPALGLPVR